MSCAPENRQKLPEIMKQFKPVEGVERLGLFFPRGSGYMYAGITKYKDYATWEKYWAEIAKERQKGISLITEEMDMFFEEVQL